MCESVVSRELREAGEAARRAARWIESLTGAERTELAAKLTRAADRYGFKDWNSYGTYDPARVMAAAEARSLAADLEAVPA
jgi:hypothetical protein